jgi:2-amino-4-hydroxy-6-hydroxymethyldihydropteridine diphosphokinase
MIGYLGVGSNVGDRRAHLQSAVDLLGAIVVASSSVYETEPVGPVQDQAAFFNACLRIETDLDPEALLDACKAVERARGRATPGEDGYVYQGPRPLDVDLLLLGDLEYVSERLTLPHPQVTTRAFVLVPLLELDPDLVVPGRGPARDFLVSDAGVVRAEEPLTCS